MCYSRLFDLANKVKQKKGKRKGKIPPIPYFKLHVSQCPVGATLRLNPGVVATVIPIAAWIVTNTITFTHLLQCLYIHTKDALCP